MISSIKRGDTDSDSPRGNLRQVEGTRPKASRIARAEYPHRYPWRRFWPRAFQLPAGWSRYGGAHGATGDVRDRQGFGEALPVAKSGAEGRQLPRANARAPGGPKVCRSNRVERKASPTAWPRAARIAREPHAAPSLVRGCVVKGCAILGCEGSRSAFHVSRS